MEGKVVTRIKQLRRSMGYARMFVALAVGVLLPVILSTSLGIVTLAMGESSDAIVLGVLVVCFAAAAGGGGIATTVLLGRPYRIAGRVRRALPEGPRGSGTMQRAPHEPAREHGRDHRCSTTCSSPSARPSRARAG